MKLVVICVVILCMGAADQVVGQAAASAAAAEVRGDERADHERTATSEKADSALPYDSTTAQQEANAKNRTEDGAPNIVKEFEIDGTVQNRTSILLSTTQGVEKVRTRVPNSEAASAAFANGASSDAASQLSPEESSDVTAQTERVPNSPSQTGQNNKELQPSEAEVQPNTAESQPASAQSVSDSTGAAFIDSAQVQPANASIRQGSGDADSNVLLIPPSGDRSVDQQRRPTLMLTARAPDHVTLAWDDFAPAGHAGGHVLQWRSVGSTAEQGTWRTKQVAPPSPRAVPQVTLDGLTPGNSYEARVVIGGDGDSVSSTHTSETVVFSTEAQGLSPSDSLPVANAAVKVSDSNDLTLSTASTNASGRDEGILTTVSSGSVNTEDVIATTISPDTFNGEEVPGTTISPGSVSNEEFLGATMPSDSFNSEDILATTASPVSLNSGNVDVTTIFSDRNGSGDGSKTTILPSSVDSSLVNEDISLSDISSSSSKSDSQHSSIVVDTAANVPAFSFSLVDLPIPDDADKATEDKRISTSDDAAVSSFENTVQTGATAKHVGHANNSHLEGPSTLISSENRAPLFQPGSGSIREGKADDLTQHIADNLPASTLHSTSSSSPLPDQTGASAKCVFNNATHQLGDEFHDACRQFCVCTRVGVQCQPIRCPRIGRELINPNCVMWSDETGVEPTPPDCCPDATCLEEYNSAGPIDQAVAADVEKPVMTDVMNTESTTAFPPSHKESALSNGEVLPGQVNSTTQVFASGEMVDSNEEQVFHDEKIAVMSPAADDEIIGRMEPSGHGDVATVVTTADEKTQQSVESPNDGITFGIGDPAIERESSSGEESSGNQETLTNDETLKGVVSANDEGNFGADNTSEEAIPGMRLAAHEGTASLQSTTELTLTEEGAFTTMQSSVVDRTEPNQPRLSKENVTDITSSEGKSFTTDAQNNAININIARPEDATFEQVIPISDPIAVQKIEAMNGLPSDGIHSPENGMKELGGNMSDETMEINGDAGGADLKDGIVTIDGERFLISNGNKYPLPPVPSFINQAGPPPTALKNPLQPHHSPSIDEDGSFVAESELGDTLHQQVEADDALLEDKKSSGDLMKQESHSKTEDSSLPDGIVTIDGERFLISDGKKYPLPPVPSFVPGQRPTGSKAVGRPLRPPQQRPGPGLKPPGSREQAAPFGHGQQARPPTVSGSQPSGLAGPDPGGLPVFSGHQRPATVQGAQQHVVVIDGQRFIEKNGQLFPLSNQPSSSPQAQDSGVPFGGGFPVPSRGQPVDSSPHGRPTPPGSLPGLSGISDGEEIVSIDGQHFIESNGRLIPLDAVVSGGHSGLAEAGGQRIPVRPNNGGGKPQRPLFGPPRRGPGQHRGGGGVLVLPDGRRVHVPHDAVLPQSDDSHFLTGHSPSQHPQTPGSGGQLVAIGPDGRPLLGPDGRPVPIPPSVLRQHQQQIQKHIERQRGRDRGPPRGGLLQRVPPQARPQPRPQPHPHDAGFLGTFTEGDRIPVDSNGRPIPLTASGMPMRPPKFDLVIGPNGKPIADESGKTLLFPPAGGGVGSHRAGPQEDDATLLLQHRATTTTTTSTESPTVQPETGRGGAQEPQTEQGEASSKPGQNTQQIPPTPDVLGNVFVTLKTYNSTSVTGTVSVPKNLVGLPGVVQLLFSEAQSGADEDLSRWNRLVLRSRSGLLQDPVDFQLDGLAPDTHYRLRGRVVPQGAPAVLGQQDPEHEFQTNSDQAEHHRLLLRDVVNTGATWARVGWTGVPPQLITVYRVLYRATSDPRDMEKFVLAHGRDVSHANVTGLMPRTRYRFKVEAYFVAGDKSVSEEGEFETEQGVAAASKPSPPGVEARRVAAAEHAPESGQQPAAAAAESVTGGEPEDKNHYTGMVTAGVVAAAALLLSILLGLLLIRRITQQQRQQQQQQQQRQTANGQTANYLNPTFQENETTDVIPMDHIDHV